MLCSNIIERPPSVILRRNAVDDTHNWINKWNKACDISGCNHEALAANEDSCSLKICPYTYPR